MLHVSTQKLIIKLCELTEAGGIAWKENDGRRLIFETEGYLVEIEERPPTLRLLQTDGRELERTDEAELAAQPWPDGNGNFATRLADMAARAHRVARGTDLAISRILSSLSAPPKRAPEPGPPFVAPEVAPRASDAILAAVAADPAPPPAPHSMPDLIPEPVETATAIERVLAAQPAVIVPDKPPPPEPQLVESETAAIVVEPEPEPAIPSEVETVAVAAEPNPTQPATPVEATEKPFLDPRPEPILAEGDAAAIVAEPPPVMAKPAPRPQSVFGATSSFSRRRDPAAAKITSSGLAFGFVPEARQTVRGEPEQASVPAPTPKPAPTPADRKPEPAVTGPDIYKPWT